MTRPAGESTSLAASSAQDARLGTLIADRYELQAVLGRGGAGVLYRGRHVRTGRPVAVKLLHAQGADESLAHQRLEREAIAATQLSHPHVVEVLDFDEDAAGQPYLVMELLQGRTLRAQLEAAGPLSPERMLELLVPIAGALAIAHDRGVLHRDVKPDNVFLAEQASGQVIAKLLDFGIARVEGGAALTQPGRVVGTIGFMSPEQLHGETITPASDQWSLAAVMQQALTGVAPRDAADASQARHASESSKPLLLVLARALEPDPLARFADLRAFVRALLAAATYAGVRVPDDPDPVGLPEWRVWREAIAREDATMAGTLDTGAGAARDLSSPSASGSASGSRPSRGRSSALPLAEGSVLADRFVLRRVLGRGAMGVVYEAEHLQIQRPCAIKLLHPALAADHELRQRFRKEAQRAGRILHEHVVAVTDYDMDGDTPFLVMELLRGESLRELLDRVGALPVARAKNIALQICRGLSAAHELGVVHRDLKPQNVFVTRRADGSDSIKILDFGVAKALRGDDSAASTQAGALLGTVRYMAPEQLRSPKDVDTRADVYAAGLILYEMLAGRPAFDATDVHATIHQLMYESPPALTDLRAELPAALITTVERAMQRDPAQRFTSAEELATALAGTEAPSGAPKAPASSTANGAPALAAKSTPASSARLLVVLLVLLAFIAAGVLVTRSGGEPKAVAPPSQASPANESALRAPSPVAAEPAPVAPVAPGVEAAAASSPEPAPPPVEASTPPATRSAAPGPSAAPKPSRAPVRRPAAASTAKPLRFDDQNPYE